MLDALGCGPSGAGLRARRVATMVDVAKTDALVVDMRLRRESRVVGGVGQDVHINEGYPKWLVN